MYNTKELDTYLSNLFEQKGYPSVAVCVRGPEGIIYDKGFGYADMAKTRKVDKDTVYGIASMSKSMTTFALALLQEEGKVSFDDPVIKYFPEFRIPGTPKECITLRHLAMHTTGLPPIAPLEWSIVMNTPCRNSADAIKLRESAPNKMDKIEDIIDYISNSGAYVPLGAPGEYMSYSNDAYAILSFVVDKVADRPLEDFLKERVFKPLGMTRTVLDQDGSEAVALAGGNITELFDIDDNGNLYSDTIWSVLPPYRGCACVKSTASDVTRYYQALSADGIFEKERVFPSGAVEAMIGHQFPELNRPFYCLGLKKRVKNGRVICEHAGGLHGVSTFGGLIKGGYSFAALCNQGDVSASPFVNACYNMVLDLPLNESHSWAVPSGNKFSSPEMLVGKYISREATPAYCIVTADADNNLHANYYEKDLDLSYCAGTLFRAHFPGTPDEEETTMEFLLRDGKAWGVCCYTRIFQRID